MQFMFLPWQRRHPPAWWGTAPWSGSSSSSPCPPPSSPPQQLQLQPLRLLPHQPLLLHLLQPLLHLLQLLLLQLLRHLRKSVEQLKDVWREDSTLSTSEIQNQISRSSRDLITCNILLGFRTTGGLTNVGQALYWVQTITAKGNHLKWHEQKIGKNWVHLNNVVISWSRAYYYSQDPLSVLTGVVTTLWRSQVSFGKHSDMSNCYQCNASCLQYSAVMQVGVLTLTHMPITHQSEAENFTKLTDNGKPK